MKGAAVCLCVLTSLACAAIASATTPAQNHAAAKAMLNKCLKAVNGLTVGPLSSNTPEVPRRNQQQAAVSRRCDNTKLTNLAFAHPSDKLLEAARTAFDELELGVGDYGQYLVDVAFNKQDTRLLHQAEREIASGKADAKRVLPRL